MNVGIAVTPCCVDRSFALSTSTFTNTTFKY